MLLGFISLLLTVGQNLITRICVSEKVAGTWHPCSKEEESSDQDDSSDHEESEHETIGRRLMAAAFFGSDGEIHRRVLAGGGSHKCGEVGSIFPILLLSSSIVSKLYIIPSITKFPRSPYKLTDQ